jgi:hypothetical protein
MNGETPRKIPVPQIGKGNPAWMSADKTVADMGKYGGAGSALAKLTEDVFKDAPDWAKGLLMEVRNLHGEIGAISLALQRRGLLTPPEINESRAQITKAMEQQLQQMVMQLGRRFAQQPEIPRPTDPRSV